MKKARNTVQGLSVHYPFSPNEHAAMARYLSGLRKQLQDVCDLFTARYGKESSLAEMAVKTLVSSTLLEHELLQLGQQVESEQESLNDDIATAA